MRKEDLRLVTWYGEGYYSGAGRLDVLAYDVNDEELLNKYDLFTSEERYLGELDGKHSCVYGDRDVEVNLIDVMSAYEDRDSDVFECEYYREADTDLYRALKKAYDCIQKLELVSVYVHKQTGEVIDMGDYKLSYTVVDKRGVHE